jgi:hypothetical protein
MRKINCSVCSTEVVSKYPKKSGMCRPCDRKKSMRKYYDTKADVKAAYDRQWKIEHREQYLASKRAYAKRNPGKYSSYCATRHAATIKRLPKWADKEAIKQFYKNRPPHNHVDHIVPLKGERVSGLHVEYNLQYLPALENIKKGNKFE